MAWKSTRTRWVIVAAAVLVVGVLVWLGRLTTLTDRRMGDALGLQRALRYYMLEHDGELPISASALIDGGYCRVVRNGVWEIPRRDVDTWDSSSEIIEVWRPDLFDVAWGITWNDITDMGQVESQSRTVVQPKSGCTHPGLEMGCSLASFRMGQLASEQRVESASTSSECPEI